MIRWKSQVRNSAVTMRRIFSFDFDRNLTCNFMIGMLLSHAHYDNTLYGSCKL